jgi:hypothetical protein
LAALEQSALFHRSCASASAGYTEHSPEEISADCDLTTARKGKTITKHMTGDSEVERDLRKMKRCPRASGENDDRLYER